MGTQPVTGKQKTNNIILEERHPQLQRAPCWECPVHYRKKKKTLLTFTNDHDTERYSNGGDTAGGR